MKNKFDLYRLIALIAPLIVTGFGISLQPPATINFLTYIEALTAKYIIILVGIVFLLISTYWIVADKNIYKIKKEMFKRIVFTLVMLAVFLSIFEVYLQTVPDPNPTARKDPVYHHAIISNSTGRIVTPEFNMQIKANSLGLRDYEIPEKSQKYRIAMLGDSFTFGYGVNASETFSKQLEKELGDNYEVINIGIPSYSPILEYLYLREDGIKLEPDMVILNFDMSDVGDDAIYESLGVFDENGNLLKVPPEPTETNPFRLLIKRIKILQRLQTAIYNVYINLNNRPIIKYSPYIGNIYTDKFAILRDTNKTFEEEWNRSFKYIEKINDILKEKNIKFIVVTYPYGHQISTTEWSKGRFLWNFEENRLYTDKPAQIISDFGRRENITVINTFGSFKDFKQNNPGIMLYLQHDGHFTSAGNEVLADIIYKNLIGDGLLNKA